MGEVNGRGLCIAQGGEEMKAEMHTCTLFGPREFKKNVGCVDM